MQTISKIIEREIKSLEKVKRKNIGELGSVIMVHLMKFLEKNFVVGNKIHKPSRFNILLILKAGNFIFKVVDMIWLYKFDYELFKEKYVFRKILQKTII